MLKQDAIQIEILDDGLIKITTDPISNANHLNAEQLLGFIAKLAGGETTITSRGKSLHHHRHEHDHVHQDGGAS